MSKKARFEVRVDAEVHATLKDLAEEAGVSMNQIIEGVLVWACDKAYAGYPAITDTRASTIETEPGPAVWFGFDGYDDDGNPVGKARFDFMLDFGSRRSIVNSIEEATE